MSGVLAKRPAAAERAAGATPDELRRLVIPHLATRDVEASPPSAKRVVAVESDLLKERAGLKALAFDSVWRADDRTRTAADVLHHPRPDRCIVVRELQLGDRRTAARCRPPHSPPNRW